MYSYKNNNLTQIKEEIAQYILMFRVNLEYFLEIFLFFQISQKKS